MPVTDLNQLSDDELGDYEAAIKTIRQDRARHRASVAKWKAQVRSWHEALSTKDRARHPSFRGIIEAFMARTDLAQGSTRDGFLIEFLDVIADEIVDDLVNDHGWLQLDFIDFLDSLYDDSE